MLEQGKWKDEAPKPSKEFHDRFEESLKLIEQRAEHTGEKALAGAEIVSMNRKAKRKTGRLKKDSNGLYSRGCCNGRISGCMLSKSGVGIQSAPDRSHF